MFKAQREVLDEVLQAKKEEIAAESTGVSKIATATDLRLK